MRARSRLLCIQFVGLAVLSSGCENHTRVADAPQADSAGDLAQPEAPPPAPNRAMSRINCYCGTVSAVHQDWIELAVGWEQPSAESRVRGWDGDTIIRREPYDNSKPKRISVVRTRPGGDPNSEPFLPACIPEVTHLVTDLLVGDRVGISTGVTPEGHEWALQLTISRRPGGRIPPFYGDPNLGTVDAAHLGDQAFQDWEEKGIPIPAKYLPKDGRNPWTNPPYPPVAPMPRSAPAKP
jgi:hypothetical protein